MAVNPVAMPVGAVSVPAPAVAIARLRTFLHWWRAELVAAMPVAWRERFAGGPSGTPILLNSDELTAFALKSGRLEKAASVSLTGLDAAARAAALQRLVAAQGGRADSVLLVLPEQAFIRKIIELPAAAEEALHQVIGFELDRHTPFRPASAVYAAKVIGRTRDNANIRVELVAAPRTIMDALIREADGMGVRIRAVVPLPVDGSGWREFDLLPRDATATVTLTADMRINLIFAAIFLLLFMAALAVPLVQKREAVIALLPRLHDAKMESEKVQKTRNDLEQLVNDANFVLGKKHAHVPVTQLVEDLSKAFPDTTWVAVLELKSGKQREVILTGETGSATRFIELLDQIGYLKNPTFRSPLSKAPGQNTERFVIAAEVRPRPLPAASEEVLAGAASKSPLPAPVQSTAPLPGAPAAPATSAMPPASGSASTPPQPAPAAVGGKAASAPTGVAPTPAPASPAPTSPAPAVSPVPNAPGAGKAKP